MLGGKIFAGLGIVAMLTAGTATAGSSGHPDAAQIRAALERQFRSRAASSANLATKAAATSPLIAFSLRGIGNNTAVNDGTCSGRICTASGGDCQCLEFSGALTATELGKASFTAGVTVNTDDCINTGTAGPDNMAGFCCFGDGVLDATSSGKSPSTLELSFTGPICLDPNADFDTSVQGGYAVVTANSTGKFSASAGTGEINLFVGDDADATTYLTANGVFQADSSN